MSRNNALRKMLKDGMGCLFVGKDGHAGISLGEFLVLVAPVVTKNLGLALSLAVQNNVVDSILNYGRASCQTRYGDILISGEWIAAFALTEPEAGSDVKSIESRAVRTQDGWQISGKKTWVINADCADIFYVLARLSDADGKIGGFLIERGNPGVKIDGPYKYMGDKIVSVGSVVLDGCHVAEENFALDAERAMPIAFRGINRARIQIASMCCKAMELGFESLMKFGETRQTFGRTLLDNQGYQWEVAELYAELVTSRWSVEQAVRMFDAEERVRLVSAVVKAMIPKRGVEFMARVMQLMGACGLLEEVQLSKYLHFCKMSQYIDGTDEVQKMVISSEMRTVKGIP